jgi:hypothetical protein
MGVGVHKARENDLAAAVDFFGRVRQRVLRDFVGGADGDDLSFGEQDCAIFNDAQLAHRRAPVSAGRAPTKGQQLRGVKEKSGRGMFGVRRQMSSFVIEKCRSVGRSWPAMTPSQQKQIPRQAEALLVMTNHERPVMARGGSFKR